jgi:hypothetical protein
MAACKEDTEFVRDHCGVTCFTVTYRVERIG